MHFKVLHTCPLLKYTRKLYALNICCFTEMYENAPHDVLKREKMYANAAFEENQYEDTGAIGITNLKTKVGSFYF